LSLLTHRCSARSATGSNGLLTGISKYLMATITIAD
jgi:hypothetical protein